VTYDITPCPVCSLRNSYSGAGNRMEGEIRRQMEALKAMEGELEKVKAERDAALLDPDSAPVRKELKELRRQVRAIRTKASKYRKLVTSLKQKRKEAAGVV